MLAIMGENGGECRLRVGPGPGGNTGCRSELRVPPVRRYGERGTHGSAVAQENFAAVPPVLETGRLARNERETLGKARGCRQMLHERCVFHVPAERVEADLAGPERDRGRAEEAPGVVDEAHGLERSRIRRHRRPDVERLEESHRAAEQRHRPPVAPRLCDADQRRPVALAGEGEGSAKAGGAGPYDGYVEVVRHGTLEAASRIRGRPARKAMWIMDAVGPTARRKEAAIRRCC
jgi:hypothetical protein